MKKCLISFAALSLMATPAFAQDATSAPVEQTINCKSIDATKLNDEGYVQGIRQVCAQQATGLPDKVTPDDVRKWASLGKDFSNAVTDTARGLGVTANEFLQTPAGLLVAFYFMWGMIGGILVGIPLIVFIWWLYFKGLRAIQRGNGTVEYDYKPFLWGSWSRKVVTKEEFRGGDGEAIGVYLLLGTIGAVIATVMDLGLLIF